MRIKEDTVRHRISEKGLYIERIFKMVLRLPASFCQTILNSSSPKSNYAALSRRFTGKGNII